MIELKDRVSFLNKIHLFSGLKENELAGIAAKLNEKTPSANEVIFERGAKPDGFYLIYKGKVNVTRPRENGTDFLAFLSTGDYFGEEALFEKRDRSATITTAEASTILFLSKDDFDELFTQYEKLRPNFLVAIKSRKLARSLRFKWLGSKEVIYFLARRHKIRLYQTLLAPVFLLTAPILLFFWSFVSGATTPYAVGGIILCADILWAVWRAVDWSNDYYIVTNQRVVWVERVIGIYDSRQEVPLSTILAVNVETDQIGRILDYGNVSVRTFVGSIRFDYVDHPSQAADMIREYWERTKATGTQAQKMAMKNALRSKLGLTVEAIPQEELPPISMEDKNVQKKSLLRIVLANIFKLRVEDGGTVTYRKHWFVLLQQVGQPLFYLLLITALIIIRGWYLLQTPNLTFIRPNAAGIPRPDSIVVFLLFVTLPLTGWLVWEYLDWSNDIFKVTPEEIIDLDKTPLGSEERRSAQIENILSTEYQRIGLMGYLLNYGTVYITVGGTKLEFQDVLDPAGVQADINRRRMARIAKKSEDTANVERERMAVWLAAYHQNVSEFTDTAKPSMEDDMKNPGLPDADLDFNGPGQDQQGQADSGDFW
ncbi:cyclic nucleotide-binding domain-containing protein [Candidatus Villigracilis saccharophilus]|uniref:cyclic nucleotide-binding domain-containing protein n=1 Tax=Candidatus Villigracilis saccharophilus TaxID=3140684 RepID=UPI003136436D|nr:cyclic nucleotide-binding domain-containing protein [Anaerolineales bacterium]